MNDKLTKTLGKVKKLLELARNNPNPHEALSAMEHAQQLMIAYGISRTEVEDDEGENAGILCKDIDTLGRVTRWRLALVDKLVRHYGCDYVWTPRTAISIIGRQVDIEVVNFFYHTLTSEINRRTKRASREKNRPGMTWAHSFRMGMVDEIAYRLQQATNIAKKEPTQAHAMVIYLQAVEHRRQDAARWVTENLNPDKENIHGAILPEAYRSGMQAGSEVDLNTNRTLRPA